MINFNNLKAQLVRKNFWMLVVIGILSILVVMGLYRIYTDVNQLEQADFDYHNALIIRLDDMQDVSHLQLEFKSQVQEWKNILLRGHDPEDYQQHWQAFQQHEEQVDKSLEELYSELCVLERATSKLDSQAIQQELSRFRSLDQLKQLETLSSVQRSQSARVLDLMRAHHIVSQVYRDALQHTSLKASANSAFAIDDQVRGLDHWFAEQLDLLYQENARARQALISDSNMRQQQEIYKLRNRIRITILLVLFSIVLDILLLVKRLRWSSAQLKLPNEQLKNTHAELKSSFDQLKISSQKLRMQAKQSQSTIFRLAYSDSLTGLPNRRMFQDRLDAAIELTKRSNTYGALLFMDLDNFKSLNDTKGHAMGDMLLIEVAKRLKSCVRDSDTVARLGGDEFVVILDDLHQDEMLAIEQASKVAAKISVTLHHPYQLNDWVHRGSASIGVALFCNGQLSSEELIKNADMAMYQAKKAGRNAVCFFDEDIQTEMLDSSELEAALWSAMSEQQLHLYYQLQVDQYQQPIGAEVLLRWLHPERGLVYPSQFIKLAEQNGLILPIGYWLIKTVCAQLVAWQSHPVLNKMTASVNVSARQLQDFDFVHKVKIILDESDVNPAHLKFEITESMALHDVEYTIRVLQQLKMLGVHLSMDDFGIGHSSLSQLKRLPLNQIKIDQSFVRDLVMDENDKSIVQTIIAMADSMKLEVIAEGVETEAQRAQLQALGCTLYQGYLFSKPLPLAEFEQLLAAKG